MTTLSRSGKLRTSDAARITDYPASSLRFDWLIAILGFTTMLGVFLDGWAHNSFPENIETFLTPWHAVLYGGVLLTGAALSLAYLRNVLRGYSLRTALPKGYMLSLIGVMIFASGGGFDFVWHSLFGFEADVEALLSPAHIYLATGAVLMMSGPLRSAWLSVGDKEHTGWKLAPAIISLAAVMSMFTFFAQFANLVTHAHNLAGQRPQAADPFVWQTATVSYVLIPAAIISAFVLFAIRRWRLPMGTFTFLLTANAALMFWLSESYSGENWPVLIGVFAAGVLIDVLYASLRPTSERVRELRTFAFAVPFIYVMAIFLPIIAISGMWWTIHMWLGAPLVAGILGLGLSVLAVPPQQAAVSSE
jgi:hypothetical protein